MFYVFSKKLLNIYVYANLGVWALNNEKLKLESSWGFEKSSWYPSKVKAENLHIYRNFRLGGIRENRVEQKTGSWILFQSWLQVLE